MDNHVDLRVTHNAAESPGEWHPSKLAFKLTGERQEVCHMEKSIRLTLAGLNEPVLVVPPDQPDARPVLDKPKAIHAKDLGRRLKDADVVQAAESLQAAIINLDNMVQQSPGLASAPTFLPIVRIQMVSALEHLDKEAAGFMEKSSPFPKPPDPGKKGRKSK